MTQLTTTGALPSSRERSLRPQPFEIFKSQHAEIGRFLQDLGSERRTGWSCAAVVRAAIKRLGERLQGGLPDELVEEVRVCRVSVGRPMRPIERPVVRVVARLGADMARRLRDITKRINDLPSPWDPVSQSAVLRAALADLLEEISRCTTTEELVILLECGKVRRGKAVRS